ncbi:hypothetical protein ACTG22_06335 [Aeromonas caviae]|uniref:hypothetical protein n=1 Tax=Aeromonas TaxID=642 RepID=UPI0030ABD578
MQCVQTLADGTLQAIAVAEGETCTTGLYLVQAADNAWAALLLDPAPWVSDMSLAFGVGITTPLLAYVVARVFGELMNMFNHDEKGS